MGKGVSSLQGRTQWISHARVVEQRDTDRRPTQRDQALTKHTAVTATVNQKPIIMLLTTACLVHTNLCDGADRMTTTFDGHKRSL